MLCVSNISFWSFPYLGVYICSTLHYCPVNVSFHLCQLCCIPQPGTHHLANWWQLKATTTLWRTFSQIGRSEDWRLMICKHCSGRTFAASLYAYFFIHRTARRGHIVPMRRYIESIFKQDLRDFTITSCFEVCCTCSVLWHDSVLFITTFIMFY